MDKKKNKKLKSAVFPVLKHQFQYQDLPEEGIRVIHRLKDKYNCLEWRSSTKRNLLLLYFDRAAHNQLHHRAVEEFIITKTETRLLRKALKHFEKTRDGFLLHQKDETISFNRLFDEKAHTWTTWCNDDTYNRLKATHNSILPYKHMFKSLRQFHQLLLRDTFDQLTRQDIHKMTNKMIGSLYRFRAIYGKQVKTKHMDKQYMTVATTAMRRIREINRGPQTSWDVEKVKTIFQKAMMKMGLTALATW